MRDNYLNRDRNVEECRDIVQNIEIAIPRCCYPVEPIYFHTPSRIRQPLLIEGIILIIT